MANGLLRCGGFMAAVVALLAGPADGFAQKGKDTVPGKIWVLQIKESGAKEWDRSVQHRVEGFKLDWCRFCAPSVVRYHGVTDTPMASPTDGCHDSTTRSP